MTTARLVLGTATMQYARLRKRIFLAHKKQILW